MPKKTAQQKRVDRRARNFLNHTRSAIVPYAAKALKGLHLAENLAARAPIPGAAQLGALIDKKINKVVDRKVHKMEGKGFYGGGRGFYGAGRGNYSDDSDTLHNSKFSSSAGMHAPKMTSSMDETGSITISRREFITDIISTGTSGFNNQGFNINPGEKGVFPWLSQAAANWTEYEAVQLVYEYVPVISKMSVSDVGSLGTVILGYNSNAGDPNWTSKAQMIEQDGSIAGRISDHIYCGVECEPTKIAGAKTKYIRAGAVPQGQDIKTYDLSKFMIAQSGVPTQYSPGTQIGELWVWYTFKLAKPRFYDGLGYSIGFDKYYTTGEGCTALLPMGSAPLKSNFNSIGGTLSIVSSTANPDGTGQAGTLYTFPDNFTGYISVDVHFAATQMSFSTGLLVPGGNVTEYKGYLDDYGVAATDCSVGSQSNTRATISCLFYVTTRDQVEANTILFYTGALSGVASGTLYINSISPQAGQPLSTEWSLV